MLPLLQTLFNSDRHVSKTYAVCLLPTTTVNRCGKACDELASFPTVGSGPIVFSPSRNPSVRQESKSTEIPRRNPVQQCCPVPRTHCHYCAAFVERGPPDARKGETAMIDLTKTALKLTAEEAHAEHMCGPSNWSKATYKPRVFPFVLKMHLGGKM